MKFAIFSTMLLCLPIVEVYALEKDGVQRHETEESTVYTYLSFTARYNKKDKTFSAFLTTPSNPQILLSAPHTVYAHLKKLHEAAPIEKQEEKV